MPGTECTPSWFLEQKTLDNAHYYSYVVASNVVISNLIHHTCPISMVLLNCKTDA